MICHDFKGGTGTASRLVDETLDRRRARPGELRRPRAPDGRRRPRRSRRSRRRAPSGWDDEEAVGRAGEGSIIVVVATDAPLLPTSSSGSRSAPASASRGWAAGRQLERRHLLGVLHGERRPDEEPQDREPGGTAGRRHGPRRVDHAPVLGRDRGHRGGDPERARRGRHDGRPRRHHRPRDPPRSTRGDHDEVTGEGRTDNGRGGGIRTRDLVLPKHVRCQAALRPACAGILRPGTVVPCDARPGTRNLLSYLLSIMLLVAIAAFAILVALQLRSDKPPRFDVGAPEGVECPTGEGTPACFSFAVTNLGNRAALVECNVTAGAGRATFLNDTSVYTSSAPFEPGIANSSRSRWIRATRTR